MGFLSTPPATSPPFYHPRTPFASTPCRCGPPGQRRPAPATGSVGPCALRFLARARTADYPHSLVALGLGRGGLPRSLRRVGERRRRTVRLLPRALFPWQRRHAPPLHRP